MRIVFLFIAFALAQLLLIILPILLPSPGRMPPHVAGNGLISWATGQPVIEMIAGRFPTTLTLLVLTLALAFVLALAGLLLETLYRRLQAKNHPVGVILTLALQLPALLLAAAPALVWALLLLAIPGMPALLISITRGASSAVSPGEWGYFFAALLLALLPAYLAYQTARWHLLFAAERRWLGSICLLAGTLFGMGGGILAALVPVETIFRFAGLGTLSFSAVMQRDNPLFFGSLHTLTAVILICRLLAESLRCSAERNVATPVTTSGRAVTRRCRRSSLLITLSLLLLLMPLGIALGGLVTDPAQALQADLQATGLPPSAGYPLGTDEMGRDLFARLLRGTFMTLMMAACAAALAWVPGSIIGMVSGRLASLRPAGGWLSRLLLLPGDILLFFPVVQGALLVIVVSLARPGWLLAAVGAGVILLPRVARLYQTLWAAGSGASASQRWLLLWSGVPLSLFAAFAVILAIDFLGVAMMPPTPSLGGLLSAGAWQRLPSLTSALVPALIAWLCSLGFLASAAAAWSAHDRRRSPVEIWE